jgi:hypothetical protein
MDDVRLGLGGAALQDDLARVQVHPAVDQERHLLPLELMSLVGRASGSLRCEPAIFQHDAMREVGDVPRTHREHGPDRMAVASAPS